MLGKTEGRRRRGQQRMRWLDSITDSLDVNLSKLLEMVRASLIAQLVKNPPAMWETPIRSLGWGRSPGEGKGYPLQYPGQENSHSPWGCKESDMTEQLSLHFHNLI